MILEIAVESKYAENKQLRVREMTLGNYTCSPKKT